MVVILRQLGRAFAQERLLLVEGQEARLEPASTMALMSAARGLWNSCVARDDPCLPLDNNATERALRGVVLGRKNHYGSRSERGTEVAALFYSLIESAKLAGVEPDAYLRTAARHAIRAERIPLPQELVARVRLSCRAPQDGDRRAVTVNYFGSRSRRGTEAPAVLYSLVESAKRAHVDPSAYLDHAAHAALRGEPIPLPHELAAKS